MSGQPHGIRAALLVVLFFGAANADATPDQRARLRDEVLPVLRDRRIPSREAMVLAVRRVAAVMGEQWRPQGEWDTWIVAILEGEESPE